MGIEGAEALPCPWDPPSREIVAAVGDHRQPKTDNRGLMASADQPVGDGGETVPNPSASVGALRREDALANAPDWVAPVIRSAIWRFGGW